MRMYARDRMRVNLRVCEREREVKERNESKREKR